MNLKLSNDKARSNPFPSLGILQTSTTNSLMKQH